MREKQFGVYKYGKMAHGAELTIEQHPLFRQSQNSFAKRRVFKEVFMVANAVNPFTSGARKRI